MFDLIVSGAGAAGRMCAATAGGRGLRVLLLEANARIGEKIRISGGGRCNFTNLHATPDHFLSENPRFCISALSRYTPADFVRLVESHGIAHHEKTKGQLFCDGRAAQIIDMLTDECARARVAIRVASPAIEVEKEARFRVRTPDALHETASLAVASGGLSIPKLGATDFGIRLARQFGHGIIAPRPGLVPLLWPEKERRHFETLAGISIDAEVSCGKHRFRDSMLFTHRGVSGPAILQISSYWREERPIRMNLLPDRDAAHLLAEHPDPAAPPAAILAAHLPRRVADAWCTFHSVLKPPARMSARELRSIADRLHRWEFQPAGTEGYEKAEVTVGGVDTRELSSQSMESKRVPGLHFIGETVDVTGWLGGYNFQWAWSSGWAAGSLS